MVGGRAGIAGGIAPIEGGIAPIEGGMDRPVLVAVLEIIDPGMVCCIVGDLPCIDENILAIMGFIAAIPPIPLIPFIAPIPLVPVPVIPVVPDIGFIPIIPNIGLDLKLLNAFKPPVSMRHRGHPWQL